MTITFPNNIKVKSTHVGLLPNYHVPMKVRVVRMFPEMKNKFRVYLGKLYDDNMTIIITKENVVFF